MRTIKIFGEIIPFEDKWIIDQGGYTNLSTVQEQLDEANGEDVKVIIRSHGGCVQTGFDIYNALRRYAGEKGARVETFGEGIVSSIATVIFLAGDKRTLTENTYPFVHNAWTYSWEGMDSKKFQRIADDLKKCDERISKHYAMHTDLTEEEALELMNNDTSISPEEAKRIRFATDIEEVFRPVALRRFSSNNKLIKMSNKALRGVFYAKKKLGLVSNKVIQTADGKDLDFYELGDEDTPAVGDKAYYDGMDADGSFIMENGDTYVFIAGVLEEIQSEDETDTENAEDLEAANAVIAEQEIVIAGLMAKVSELENTIQASKAKSKPAPASDKSKSGEENGSKNKGTVASKAVANWKENINKKK
jgi:ATP-dependent Clp protease protease subunit